MRIFQPSGSEGSSNSSSVDEAEEVEDDDLQISPLAMMNEGSPEAWLGNFLAILGVAGSARYSTIEGSKRDETLITQLRDIAEISGRENPMRLLEGENSESLKTSDWATWWRLEGELGRYAYSVLALSLLRDTTHRADLPTLYRQTANSRIQKDAHYVLCHLLGKSWPGYNVTESDLRRVAAET
ncbi:MAG TPA: hypothetical protein VEX13_08545 [Chloroflexia bacterium]|nr:hypothetical protein [Chloroflexia bacterium]